jgi:hypothetical protein
MRLDEVTCNAIRESIQRHDYGKSVLAHLEDCEQCLDVATNTVLAGREDVHVPPVFVSRVLVQVSSSTTPTAAMLRTRNALWPAIAVVCAVIAVAFLPHLSAFAQSWWGAAVLAAAGMESSLIIVWVLGGNRPAATFARPDAPG